MKKSLQIYIDESRILIDSALDRYLPAASLQPKTIHRAMRYSVFSGGKRIRPIIVLEACKVCGGKRHHLKDAIIIASAIEMVHTYSLIHDDLPSMDDDDYRRGKPTCHKKFGEANAILAGDALLTLAFNLLAKNLEADIGLTAVRDLSDAIGTCGMVGGQAMDIIFKDKRAGASAQKKINDLKTGRLFEVSARLGAIASGTSEKNVKAMSEFGKSLGEAFQFVDDIMDSDTRSGDLKIRAMAEGATFKAIRALDKFGAEADNMREIAYIMLKRRV